MKKIINEIAIQAGFVLVILGLIVCMCETAEPDKQLVNMLCGVGIIVVGTIICYIGKEMDHGTY